MVNDSLSMTNKLIILLTIVIPLLTVGQSDTLSNKKGKWLFFGKENPDTVQVQPRPIYDGYHVHYRSDSTKSAEGEYEHNFKNGLWIYYFADGTTVRRKETYRTNKLNGPYQEFYEDGALKESGFYENNKRRTLISRYYPSGCLEYSAYYDETGKEEGIVQYYFDCDSINNTIGQLEFKYTAASGVPNGKAIRYHPDGRVREHIEYGSDGRVISREEQE